MSEAERFRIADILRIPEIRAAMLGTFVIMLGYGILSPVLPNYAKSFGVGYDAVGLLISSFSFARLVADPFVGRYIDRYGERAMSTLGAVWVGVSSFAAALAPTFPPSCCSARWEGSVRPCSSRRCSRSCCARSRHDAPVA